MNAGFIRFFFLSLLMVLLQVVIFNHIHLFGIAIPLVFIYVIMKLPLSLSTVWVLTVSFLLGLAVDIFSNTPGMNALACTILAFVRRPVLSLYLQHGSDYVADEPSMRSFGMGLFVRYALSLTLIYCLLLFVIESFFMFDALYLVLRVVCSTLLTFILILCFDSLSPGRREKRL